MKCSDKTKWILLRWLGGGGLPPEVVLHIGSYLDPTAMVMLYHAHAHEHTISVPCGNRFVRMAAYYGHVHIVNVYGCITDASERSRVAIAAARGSNLEIVKQWMSYDDNIEHLLNFASLYSNYATWSWLMSNVPGANVCMHVLSRIEDMLPFETDIVTRIHHHYGRTLLECACRHGRDWIARVYEWMKPRIAMDCDIYKMVRSVDNIDLFQVVYSASVISMRQYRWKTKIRAWLAA